MLDISSHIDRMREDLAECRRTEQEALQTARDAQAVGTRLERALLVLSEPLGQESTTVGTPSATPAEPAPRIAKAIGRHATAQQSSPPNQAQPAPAAAVTSYRTDVLDAVDGYRVLTWSQIKERCGHGNFSGALSKLVEQGIVGKRDGKYFLAANPESRFIQEDLQARGVEDGDGEVPQ